MKIDSKKCTTLLWFLSAPLLLEWGLGVAHPLLDWLALPGALLLSLPAALGLPGLGAVGLLAGLAGRGTRRSGPLDLAFSCAASVGGMALIAACLPLARPLIWLVLVPLVASSFSPPAQEDWLLRDRKLGFFSVLCWGACLFLPPGGGFALTDALSSVLPPLLRSAPPWSLLALSLSALAVAARLLHRQARGRPGLMLASVLAVLLLDSTVGTPVSLPFALGLAALLGAWPLPLHRGLTQPVAIALPLLAVTGLIGFGAGLGGRWLCPAGDGEQLRFLTQDPGASDVAVIPGNLPFILLLRGDAPARLERLSPTGVVSESVALERPGGRLVSSGTSGGQVARLVPRGSEGGAPAQVEWWNPSTMERVALVALPPSCAPEGGQMAEDSPAIALSCSDGRLLRVDPQVGSWSDIGDPSTGSRANYSSDSLPVRLRGGPLARFVIETSTQGSAPALGPFFAGPWTNRARVTPGGLILARGPLGQIEVRGEDPLWTLGALAPPSSGAERKADEARHVLDRARIPGWPEFMLWSPHHAALWVTSRNSGDISLVDTQVTWHRKTVAVGPPPRAVVVDASSGTLFGVNRCGLFTLRIPSIFPWESTGDVEGAALDPLPDGGTL